MDENREANKHCSDCAEVLSGERTHPHQYLVLIASSATGDPVYRCLLCDTCMCHDPSGDTAWSECDDTQAHAPIPNTRIGHACPNPR